MVMVDRPIPLAFLGGTADSGTVPSGYRNFGCIRLHLF